jgi:hypothetical protein
MSRKTITVVTLAFLGGGTVGSLLPRAVQGRVVAAMPAVTVTVPARSPRSRSAALSPLSRVPGP